MATYAEIQAFVRARNHFSVKTCWIADLKHRHGLITRTAPNRIHTMRRHPCPAEKQQAIEEAFRHFRMI